MRFYLMSSVTLVGLLALAACGDDSGTAGGGGEPPTGPVYVIDIVVDANRDGKVDPASAEDQDTEETWDATSGAMFLPNLDDDDADGVRDSDDNKIGSGTDSLDFSVIHISACADCPADTKGILEIDAEAAKHVRIFALADDNASWVPVLGEVDVCYSDDEEVEPVCSQVTRYEISGDRVISGADLVIEGRDFLRSPEGWSGYLDAGYAITDKDGALLTSEANPDGVDKVRMRVAPWQLFGNLHPFDTVWSSSTSSEFVNGIEDATEAAQITYETYSGYGDQWTQDFFQTGYFAVTRQDEEGNVVPHGMKVANARPWGRNNSDAQLPYRWLEKNYLGPDAAIIAIYKTKHTGSSFDSHGNHDLLPPYENGDSKYPLGRILHGSGIQAATTDFYAAQLLQGPVYEVETDWLYVGHVDEFLSYVPANTPRGWKLLISSPRLSREMLTALSEDGNGALLVHEGKSWIDFDTGGEYDADITIDDLLADPMVLEASQDAQALIDQEVDKIIAEVGLTDDEVIEMPNLFQEVSGYKVAYQPGTVNSLVFGDYIVIPKPFGPKVAGVDVFEKDLEDRLGGADSQLGKDGSGMKVYFTDDWDTYHRLDGEVHCGTNPEVSVAPYASGINWWGTGR